MFKINISESSGKTYKLEKEIPFFIGKELHDKIKGEEIVPELKGYELEITGTSDKAGFTSLESVEGIGLKKNTFDLWQGNEKKTKKRRQEKNF